MEGLIEYELSGADLGEVRFAISPMNELVLSLRMWREPGRFPLQLPWLRLTAEARAGLDQEVLLALTNEQLWLPDFLNPRPWSPMTLFEDELDLIAGTDLHVVVEDVAEVHPDPHTRPPALTGRPDRVRRRIVDALEAYWTTCFAPWWPRMRAVLQSDIVYRGRTIARDGLAAMLAGLSPRIRLRDDVIAIQLRSNVRFRRSVSGEGLTLLPTLFGKATTPISPEKPPQIIYEARGAATLWESDRPTPPAALAALIGSARARLLTMLDGPASSTELAIRLGVSTSAVNQHLRALREAGLLTSARHGRAVLYLRSELGDALRAGRRQR